jgi:uncharacterized protein YyaL (SSP411 family)
MPHFATAMRATLPTGRGRSTGPVGRLAGLTWLTARDTVAARLAPHMPVSYDVPADALARAIAFLHRTHDVTGRRGSSKGFSLLFGWAPAFPETTGYIIGTLLEHDRRTGAGVDRRCIEMGDWELELQALDGGIMEGVLDGTPRPSEAFNTGMVMHGWLDLHAATGDARYLEAADRAGAFLDRVQDADGAWRGTHSYNAIGHTYMSRVAWAQLRLAAATGTDSHAASAHRHLRWVLSMQRDNGWFEACIFKPGMVPNTHAIAYTLRGLIESFDLSGRDEYLLAVQRTSEVLIRKLEVLGALPGTFDAAWKPRASYVCLTGLVQLGGVWLRLYQLTGDARFLNAGLKAVDLGAAHQYSGPLGAPRGALPGSFPIYGRYAPLQFPNWATKFLADSLMLRADCLAS